MPTLAAIGIIFAYLNWRKKPPIIEKNADSIKHSAFYCAELCLFHAKNQNIKESLKYAIDLKNFASGDASKDVDSLVEMLKFIMENKLYIGDESLNNIEVLLHNVRMGWEK